MLALWLPGLKMQRSPLSQEHLNHSDRLLDLTRVDCCVSLDATWDG
jgi:hypothetical protein